MISIPSGQKIYMAPISTFLAAISNFYFLDLLNCDVTGLGVCISVTIGLYMRTIYALFCVPNWISFGNFHLDKIWRFTKVPSALFLADFAKFGQYLT